MAARQAAREIAVRAGFTGTELTLLATAVSEVARNIVRFADHGELTVEMLDEPRPGIRVVARDTGPGIADVERALADGYSTDEGLGLGLPGARRLVDEFDIASEPGRGTTVVHDQVVRQEGLRMNEHRRTPRTRRDDRRTTAMPDGTDDHLLPQLVAHLREHRAKLREEWAGRIHDAHLLEAMTPQEMAAETT